MIWLRVPALLRCRVMAAYAGSLAGFPPADHSLQFHAPKTTHAHKTAKTRPGTQQPGRVEGADVVPPHRITQGGRPFEMQCKYTNAAGLFQTRSRFGLTRRANPTPRNRFCPAGPPEIRFGFGLCVVVVPAGRLGLPTMRATRHVHALNLAGGWGRTNHLRFLRAKPRVYFGPFAPFVQGRPDQFNGCVGK